MNKEKRIDLEKKEWWKDKDELDRQIRYRADFVPEITIRELLAVIDRQASEKGVVQAFLDDADKWIRDLQSGLYVNCVYCGHRYGPEDEIDNMADALKQHIELCPKHPMSALRTQLAATEQSLANWRELQSQTLAALTAAENRENQIVEGFRLLAEQHGIKIEFGTIATWQHPKTWLISTE